MSSDVTPVIKLQLTSRIPPAGHNMIEPSINMSRSPGCQPSPLIEAIFYRLPYFTSGLASNISIENILDDFVVSTPL